MAIQEKRMLSLRHKRDQALIETGRYCFQLFEIFVEQYSPWATYFTLKAEHHLKGRFKKNFRTDIWSFRHFVDMLKATRPHKYIMQQRLKTS